jgi:hypothetical protein
MKVKHSKYKNTGLIFELLVKQVASDTLEGVESPALKIIKKYFTGKSTLVREFKLYEFISKNRGVSQVQADNIVSTILEVARKMNKTLLKNQKYNLIKEIKDSYNVEDFFSMKVADYKPLAATYCLIEAHTVDTLVDPSTLVNNRLTVLEHLTAKKQDKTSVRESLVEEFSKYDKDVRMLTYKILLEKFNGKYTTLLPEQKNLLKEFITSNSSTTKLRALVNEELKNIQKSLSQLETGIDNKVVKIKVNEITKGITLLANTEKVTDDDLVTLMQYYELVKELRSV